MIKKILIKNLSKNITSRDLFELFSRCGKVISVYIRNENDTLNYGIINMRNARHAVSQLNGKEFKGCHLKIKLDYPSKKNYKNQVIKFDSMVSRKDEMV